MVIKMMSQRRPQRRRSQQHRQRSASPRRSSKDLPPKQQQQQQQHRSTIVSLPQSVDSYNAEQAAQRLEKELRQKGYDPVSGGSLLQQESLDHSVDLDKYWQTPEQDRPYDSDSYYTEDDDDEDYTEDYDDSRFTRDSRFTGTRAEQSTYYSSIDNSTLYTERSVDWETGRHDEQQHDSRDDGVGRRVARHQDDEMRDGPPPPVAEEDWSVPQRVSQLEQHNTKIKTIPTYKSGNAPPSPRQMIRNEHKAKNRHGHHNKRFNARQQQSLYYSDGDDGGNSSEDSFTIVSKLQDPRTRNPHYLQQHEKDGVKKKRVVYESKVAPRDVVRQQRQPQQRKKKTIVHNNDEQEEDPSVFQLHKRHGKRNEMPQRNPKHSLHKAGSHLTRDSQGRKLITGAFVVEEDVSGHSRNIIPQRKQHAPSPSSAMTRPIANKNTNTGRRSPPSYHHDMAGRIQERFFEESEASQIEEEAFELQEMSTEEYDRNITTNNVPMSDGAPPSNVAVFGNHDPLQQLHKGHPAMMHATDLSNNLMGKELLFVQDEGEPTKRNANISSSALTSTPPRPPTTTTKRRQPAFLAKHHLDPQVVQAGSGDIELQLPEERHDGIYLGTKEGTAVEAISTTAQAPTRGVMRKRSGFLSKLRLRKDVATKKAKAVSANTVDNVGNVDDDCGLVSRKELVQEGWSPSDLPDEIAQPQSDMSLFGRLIALRSSHDGKSSAEQQKKEPEEEIEDAAAVSPKATQEWEVLSRESECLSEENEDLIDQENKLSLLRSESNAVSAGIMESKGGSSNASASIASAPVVYRMSQLNDEEDHPKKKKKSLLKRMLPSKPGGDGNKQAIENVSSIQASRGSSIPSMSNLNSSVASNGSTKNTIKVKNTTANSKTSSTVEDVALNSLGDKYSSESESQDDGSAIATRKRDPPVANMDAPSRGGSIKTATTGSTVAGSQSSKAPSLVAAASHQATLPSKAPSSIAKSSVAGSPVSASSKADSSIAKQLSVSKSDNSTKSELLPDRQFMMMKSSDDTPKTIEKKESHHVIEEMLTRKAPHVINDTNDATEAEIAALRASILSADSDDGIPVPSVSVNELRAMLQHPVDATDKDTSQDKTALQDKPKKKRSFGMARLLQKSSSQNNETALGDALSETGASDDVADKENDAVNSKEEKPDGSKSLLDTASAQSSVGTTSVDASEVVERTVLTFNPSAASEEDSNSARIGPPTTCESIDDILQGDEATRKNVRFSEFVETLTLSASSTYDENSRRSDEEEKAKVGAKKKLLRWIAKKRSKKSIKLTPVIEGDEDEASFDFDSIEQDQRHMERDAFVHDVPSDGHKAAQPSKRIESSQDGIELVARRTRNGKNAILISNSIGNVDDKAAVRTKNDTRKQQTHIQKLSARDVEYAGSLKKPPTKKGGFMRSIFGGNGTTKRSRSSSPRRKHKGRRSSSRNATRPQQTRARSVSPPPTNSMRVHQTKQSNGRSTHSTNRSAHSASSTQNVHLQRPDAVINTPFYGTQHQPTQEGRDMSHLRVKSAPPTPSPHRQAAQPNAMQPAGNLQNAIVSEEDKVIRESSFPSRASSGVSLQYTKSSNNETDITKTNGTAKKEPPRAKPKVPKPASTTNSGSDDWFSWLWGPVAPPIKPALAEYPQTRNPQVSRMTSTGTKKSMESRITEASRSTMGTSYHGDEYSQDYTHSTPSTAASFDEQAVKSTRSRKKTKSSAPPTKQQEELEQIPERQWQEILDATETLAMSYKQKQRKMQAIQRSSDNSSVSEESIDEVKRAILKFKQHAQALGVQERELMEAVRDDDRSVPSKQKRRQHAQQAAAMRRTASKNGGVTDKFIEMYTHFFVGPKPTQPKLRASHVQ